MRAGVCEGLPDARIERPTDVLVHITTTNICGSDLHMYEGRTDMETGRVLGHENLGEVIEGRRGRPGAGRRHGVPAVQINCGFCANCERSLTALCLTTNPDPRMAGVAYGFAGMGPYNGGQAELLRVPYGDVNCLVLPPDARHRERQRDYVMLADIFPTGWHATQLGCVQTGDTAVIYGAGPVGQMAAMSATIKNASKVMVVDHHTDRLALAERVGATPVDEREESPLDRVLEETNGRGAARECVSYQAHDSNEQDHPNAILNALVQTVRFAGTIGVVGLFVPKDPGSPEAKPSRTVVRRVARAPARPGTRTLRQAGTGLDEGRHTPRRVTVTSGHRRGSPRPREVVAP